MTEKLIPCPWCGSEDISTVPEPQILPCFVCVCPECCARGPMERSELKARAAWNDREGFDSPKRKDSPIAERGDEND